MAVTDFDTKVAVVVRDDPALYTADIFETGNHADAVLRGLKRHP
jgi:hypothetical protein